jgi:hypothetical protein
MRKPKEGMGEPRRTQTFHYYSAQYAYHHSIERNDDVSPTPPQWVAERLQLPWSIFEWKGSISLCGLVPGYLVLIRSKLRVSG